MKTLTDSTLSRLRSQPSCPANTLRTPARSNQHWISLAWLAVGSLLVAGPLFYAGLFRMIATDHDLHVKLIQRGIEDGVWPVHFLFPALVYGLSGLSHEFAPLARAAVVVLTASVVAKAWLTYVLLVRSSPSLSATMSRAALTTSPATLLLLISAALLVAAPIVRPWWTNRVYLGQISPNVWHNPTSIVCWPLAILLFFAADDFLRAGRFRALTAVGFLSAVSVLAKPNYFLAFAPVFGLLGLRRFGLSRLWIVSQVVLAPTVLILVWQMWASFDGPHAMRPGIRVTWLPLAAWHLYTRSIAVSLLVSLAFPLSYVIVFRRSLQNVQLLLFAWGVMLSALVWTSCFAEVRAAHGVVDPDFNFSWGSHLAIFVLFLVTAMDMVGNSQAIDALARNSIAGRITRLPWWLLGAHAASGAYWMIRQAVGRGYC